MKRWYFVAFLLVAATFLGATVFREPLAYAAQAVCVTIVRPLDSHGNVKVHEQGMVGARDVDNPALQPFQQRSKSNSEAVAWWHPGIVKATADPRPRRPKINER